MLEPQSPTEALAEIEEELRHAAGEWRRERITEHHLYEAVLAVADRIRAVLDHAAAGPPSEGDETEG